MLFLLKYKNYFFRILAFLLLAPIVSSCGFTVIYREKDSGISYEKELASIVIQKAPGKINQEIRNSLYDIFNPDKIYVDPKYIMIFKVSESTGSTFLTSSGASGRNKVTLALDYEIIDYNTSKIIKSGSTIASDNYDIQQNRFATVTAEEYVKINLVKIISQNLRNLIVNDIIDSQERSKKN